MSAVPATPLHLATRRGPTGVASELREVTRLPFSIGRAPDNDWTLPDPGRVLSKHHCRITANGDTWLITDTSSNGTFLNGASLDPEVPKHCATATGWCSAFMRSRHCSAKRHSRRATTHARG